MSHISNALDAELKLARKTAADLSRATKITEAQLCRIKNGTQVWVGAVDLNKIAVGLYPANTDSAVKAHSRLLYARLQDECVGPGAEHIKIELLNNPSPKKLSNGTAVHQVLPPALQKNLDHIAAHITSNRHVRDLIGTVAELCGPPDAPQARSKSGSKK